MILINILESVERPALFFVRIWVRGNLSKFLSGWEFYIYSKKHSYDLTNLDLGAGVRRAVGWSLYKFSTFNIENIIV